MTWRTSFPKWTCALVAATTLSACADAPTGTVAPAAPGPSAIREAVRFWDALATTRWNRRATDLLRGLPAGTPSNGQAWASRTLTYLSLAQYRAALAATAPSTRPKHPSATAAVGRASFEVLTAFFRTAPGVPEAVREQITATLDQQRMGDASPPRWLREADWDDVAEGDAIGLAAAQAVLAEASRDGYLSRPAPVPPAGATSWVPGGPVVRSLWGATPFFLAPQDLLLSPPPPPDGSPEFQAALAEVYAVVSARTPGQLEIALKWDKVPPNGPYTAGSWNEIAEELIRSRHRKEVEAARILAYANAAAFDAQIDCFTTKFAYWVRRPSQADPRLEPYLAFRTPTSLGIPNHPSYPSAHSCISAAFGAVLAGAFPRERRWLDAQVEEAGMSRIYAGIHYRFDIDAGQEIGQRAAAKALAGSLE
jgi:membrane-associated phospholipid phosphatase